MTDQEKDTKVENKKPKVKNWDKIVRDLEDEDEDDKKKPEGDEAVNKLFQQIYSNANPETRRAMMKSFQESNGTCLSTNWAEVSKGKVEVTPPQGMESKKYEQ